MGRLGLTIAIVLVIVVVAVGAYYLVSKGILGGGIRKAVEGAVDIKSIELYVDPGEVTEDKTPVEVRLGVYNSFPVNVRIRSGELTLSADKLDIAEVSIPSQEIKRGYNTVTVFAVIDNTLIDEFWYRHLSRNEESNITLQGSLVFDTPIGDLKIPVKYSRVVKTKMFPVERELDREYDLGLLGKIVVEKIRVDLASISPSETRLKVDVTVKNELKTIPLYVNGLVFELKLGDGTILGGGEQEYAKSIAPGETDNIVFDVALDNSKLPILWYKHIRNREHTEIDIEVWFKIRVAGKNIELFRNNPLTTTIVFETNIFKYKG